MRPLSGHWLSIRVQTSRSYHSFGIASGLSSGISPCLGLLFFLVFGSFSTFLELLHGVLNSCIFLSTISLFGSGTSISSDFLFLIIKLSVHEEINHDFPLLVAGDLTAPTLPAATLLYDDASNPLPRHFSQAAPNAGSPIGADNTPASNRTTNAGAALGRVLFYDRRLSVNDRVSCSSCHQQQFAFSDTATLSRGFTGGFTGRHSMGLTNARFYASARFFWDERAATLEAQVLQPIQDGIEMGMTLPNALTKLSATTYYPALFTAAFGTSEITSDRVALALSQFVRSLVSVNSKFDRAFGVNGVPNFAASFTAQELAGQDLFNGRAGCARCHGTNAHISDGVHNTGLDATITDVGAGNGRFKAPSLRNIAVRPPYMHDGRFRTLEQVIAFYDSGVQNNPGLDPRLRGPGGQPLRLNLSAADRASLVAFMGTLTDNTFLADVRFSNPFGR